MNTAKTQAALYSFFFRPVSRFILLCNTIRRNNEVGLNVWVHLHQLNLTFNLKSCANLLGAIKMCNLMRQVSVNQTEIKGSGRGKLKRQPGVGAWSWRWGKDAEGMKSGSKRKRVVKSERKRVCGRVKDVSHHRPDTESITFLTSGRCRRKCAVPSRSH